MSLGDPSSKEDEADVTEISDCLLSDSHDKSTDSSSSTDRCDDCQCLRTEKYPASDSEKQTDCNGQHSSQASLSEELKPCTKCQKAADVISKGKADLRKKIAKTSILYAGVFIMGLQWGMIGPSLPDLEMVTGASTSFLSIILTGRNVASLAGSALAGFLIDRYNAWLLLGMAEVFLGLLFALIPVSNKLAVLAVCLIPSGLAAGFYDTGVNVAVLRVWAGRPGPWIQAMECIDAIGSFVAPLLAHPFLAYKAANPWEEEMFSDLNDTSDSIHGANRLASNGHYTAGDGSMQSVISNDSVYNSSIGILKDVNSTSFSGGVFNQSDISMIAESSHVLYAYLMVGLFLAIAASLHLTVFFKNRCQLTISKDSCDDDEASQSTSLDRQEKFLRILILPMLFLICFSYYALETGYGNYLMTFAVKYLKWNRDSGVALTSAFWGAYTAGTAVGIVIIKFISPRTLLLMDIILCLTSQLVLTVFLHSHPAVIWACTIAAGLSTATVFASIFSWAQMNIGVDGKVNSIMMAGMSIGEMTSPAILGILIDKSGAISWVYFTLSAAILCTVVLIFMQILAIKLKRVHKLKTQVIDVEHVS